MKKFSKGGVGMFAIKDLIKLFLIVVFGLFVQIIPAYAAIQTESMQKINSTIEPIPTEDKLIETIHSPPKIVLSVENDFTVETFYPEEISYDEVKSETNFAESDSYIRENSDNLLPRITLTAEDDIMVETFYPSEYELKITENKNVPSQNQENKNGVLRAKVISLSLDGTNSVQYFEQGEPALTSLNFVVGKSTLSEGIVFCAEFMQYL